MTNSLNTMCNLIANGNPISKAIKQVYKTNKVSIPFNNGDFDIPVTSLNLSTRSTNTLMRNGLVTLQMVIDYIDKNSWKSIKTFGEKSASEVFEKILDVAWDNMSIYEKGEFLIQIETENEII